MEFLSGITFPFVYGRGYTEAFRVAAPAVGATATYTVRDATERIRLIKFRLTTSATVANRSGVVRYFDQDQIPIMESSNSGLQAASSAWRYHFYPELGAIVNGSTTVPHVPIPDMFLIPGFSIKLDVSGLDAGDQIDQIYIVRERFFTGDVGFGGGTSHSDTTP